MDIEDLLYKFLYDFNIESPNRSILESICKQTEKGVALTDRQYALVLEKLTQHEDVFLANNIILTDLKTRLPLRSINREKYIKIVERNNALWIKVRFPFAKKDIVKIQSLHIPAREYEHVRSSHEHFYKLTGVNAYAVVDALKNRNFNIDADLVEYVNKVSDVLDNSNLYNSSFENVIQRIDSPWKESLSEMSDLIKADRSLQFGYVVDSVDIQTLTQHIAYRDDIEVTCDPDTWTMQDIVDSIAELKRFPLVVTIDESDAFEQVSQIHNAFSPYVDNSLQSVMFRVDNNDVANNVLNQYIKDHKLNNWVDNRTKIVYIKKNKLPKPLLESDFIPICSLSKTSIRSHNNVRSYIDLNCDCILHNDKSSSFFDRRRYQHYG